MKIQNGGEEPTQEPSFYNYLVIIMKYRYFITIFVFVALVGSVVVGAYIPKKYSATASIMPGDPVQSIGLLGSFNVRDALIERLGIEAPTLEDARHKFNSMVTVRRAAGGIVIITAVDTDPERAANIVNGMIEELDRINTKLLTSSGGKAKVNAERQLEETRLALEKAEETLLNFEVEHKELTLFNLSKNSEESAKGYVLKKQIDRTASIKEQKRIDELRSEVLGLSNMLVGLKVDRMRHKSELMAAPDYSKLMLRYARLTRDVQVKQAFYNALTNQYQEAMLQEVQYVPTVAVLDKAIVPQKKSGPNRSLIVEVSVIAALLFSVFMSFLIEIVRRARCGLKGI